MARKINCNCFDIQSKLRKMFDYENFIKNKIEQ